MVRAPSEEATREIGRWKPPRHVVVEVRVERLVFRVQFGSKAHQQDVAFVVGQFERQRELVPSRIRVGCPRRGDVRDDPGQLGTRSEQGIDVLVRDVQPAEFIERQFVAGAHPSHLGLDQRVESRQLHVERVEVAGHGPRSSVSVSRRPSGRTTAARVRPDSWSRTSSGARPSWAVLPSPLTDAGIERSRVRR